jgi:hypothetical protein
MPQSAHANQSPAMPGEPARLPWWQAAIVVAILSALCWAGVISIILAIGCLF